MMYYSALENMHKRHDREALDWFNDFFQLCQNPQLHRRGIVNCRSFEAEFIAENKPEYLIGVLKSSWGQYCPVKDWDEYFKAVKIPLIDSNETLRLEDTYLPLPKLRKIVSQLNLDSRFGFIEELSNIQDIDAAQWEFLERFDVKMDADVRF
jgi:hypothetical protein